MEADKPVNLTLSTEEFATKWAEVTIDRFHMAMDDLDIGKLDGALWRSLHADIVKNNGDVQKVVTRFLQYGRFLDMGVGRGVPIGAAGTGAFSAARNANGSLKKYRRKPKKWYSKTYYSEVQRFKELFIKLFNQQVPAQIVETLSGDINLTA